MTKIQLLRILFISLTLSVPFALLVLLALQTGAGLDQAEAWRALFEHPLFVTLFLKAWGVEFLALFVGLSLLVVWPLPRRAGAPAGGGSGGERLRGKVKWFNARKGYGFILLPDGKELFVHYREIQGQGRRNLNDGQEVEFSIGQGRKGPEARNVRPL
ncbi:MAG: cold shock domain-containing protein [Gammaproteobacteria bacterium]|nr:MAG: cold shock domain-containing protein [Gammaproteobacteria bacterium]